MSGFDLYERFLALHSTASLWRGDIAGATTGMDFGRMNRLIERVRD